MKAPRAVLVAVFLLIACDRAAASDILARPPMARDQIEELVSPIALYPDPLIALILPATTRPSDLVLAARFVEGGGIPEQAASEPWDDSVKALTRYPEALAYLDQNLGWARSLGECFLDRPDEVMSAIQAVRARARSAGLLVDTAEQTVVVDGDEICIVPANPTVIYVPRYSPEILYVRSFPFSYSGPFLSFGIGYRVGSWLSYDCDWRFRFVRIVHRPDHWYRQPDWRRRHADHDLAWNRWNPSSRPDRHFDAPRRYAGPDRRQNPHRNLPGSAYGFAPAPRRRDAGRPITAAENRRAVSTPAYQHPSAPAARHHDSAGYAAGPGRNRQPPSGFRPAQGQPTSPPRIAAPPVRQPRPGARAAPAETHRDRHDSPPSRPHSDSNDRRQR